MCQEGGDGQGPEQESWPSGRGEGDTGSAPPFCILMHSSPSPEEFSFVGEKFTGEDQERSVPLILHGAYQYSISCWLMVFTLVIFGSLYQFLGIYNKQGGCAVTHENYENTTIDIARGTKCSKLHGVHNYEQFLIFKRNGCSWGKVGCCRISPVLA